MEQTPRPSSAIETIVIEHRGNPVAILIRGDAYSIRPTLGWIDSDVMDPQYRFNTRGAGRYRKTRKALDDITKNGLALGFDQSIINPQQTGSIICFAHNDQLPELLPDIASKFAKFALCQWVKPAPPPVSNKHYRPDREFYVHAWSKGFHPQGTLAEKSRSITASPSRTLKKRFNHPTIKPPAVMDKIMRNVAGTTVCDSFMGTGSTGVSAIQHGKLFFGIEQNPTWFEAAVTRINETVEQL